MDPGIVGAWIGAIAAGLIGAVGWVLAGLANGKAKEANKLAQRANDIATEAVRQAAEANQIAENANTLSAESNQIVQRQAAQAVEQHVVEWVVDKEQLDRSVFTLNHRGSHTAYRPTVTIKVLNVYEFSDGHDDVTVGGQLVIPFPESVQAEVGQKKMIAMIDMHTVYGRRSLSVRLEVRWFTELGNPREQILQARVK